MMTVQQVIKRLEELEKAKSDKVKEIIFHSTPKRVISDEIRNVTVLQLVEELRIIQEEINDIYSMKVE